MSEFPKLSDLSRRQRERVLDTQRVARALQSVKMGNLASEAEVSVVEAQEPSVGEVLAYLSSPDDVA